MDIDFHFGTIYVLSRWAGFNELDAKVLATASQLVDDNTPKLKVNENYRCSGHEPLENISDLKDNNEIWIPFHFLPNLNENAENKLLCKKNSNLANQLADELKSITDFNNKNIFRLGIGLHVYADTWAHQEFLGKISHENIVRNPKIIHPKQGFLEKFEDELINRLPPLGHAKGIHWPDRPYVSWSCGLKFPNGRENWTEFLEAARAIYSILTTVRGNENILTKGQEGSLLNCFKGFTDENCDNRNKAWIDYINQGNFDFNDFLVGYSKGYILGDSTFCPQFYAAIDEHYDWVKEKLEADNIHVLN